MENFIALEVWVVLVAAPCIISWILGEMHGAARMRQLVEETAQPRVPMTLPPKIAPQPAPRQQCAGPAASANVNRLEQERSRQRRETFDGMPSLAELQAQTQQIRQSDRIWESADLTLSAMTPNTISNRVLEHYRGSIDELARHNSGQIRDVAGFTDDDLPRFSDAAPIQLDARIGLEIAELSGAGGARAPKRVKLSPDTQFI